MSTKLKTIDKSDLQKLLDESCSYADVFRKLGYNTAGDAYNYKLMKIRINNDKLNVNKLEENRGSKVKVNKKSITDLATKNSHIIAFHSFKRRLINEGFLDYKCRDCGNTGEWLGKKLVLQLEHIDGDRLNNELSNLTLLCPNCHSQTSTYAGRKLKKKININICKKCNKQIHKSSVHCRSCVIVPQRQKKFNTTKDELEELILNQNMSYVDVGKRFGVSDNAIKKRCKRLDICLPVRRKTKK